MGRPLPDRDPYADGWHAGYQQALAELDAEIRTWPHPAVRAALSITHKRISRRHSHVLRTYIESEQSR